MYTDNTLKEKATLKPGDFIGYNYFDNYFFVKTKKGLLLVFSEKRNLFPFYLSGPMPIKNAINFVAEITGFKINQKEIRENDNLLFEILEDLPEGAVTPENIKTIEIEIFRRMLGKIGVSFKLITGMSEKEITSWQEKLTQKDTSDMIRIVLSNPSVKFCPASESKSEEISVVFNPERHLQFSIYLGDEVIFCDGFFIVKCKNQNHGSNKNQTRIYYHG